MASPGVFKTTAVGDFVAIAPEATVDGGVEGNGIGGFDFDGEAEIESISAAVLTENIHGAEGWELGEGRGELMFLIGTAHEVVLVANGESGNDAAGGGDANGSFESEAKPPENGIGGVGVNREVERLCA